jgi:hypothetical protein
MLALIFITPYLRWVFLITIVTLFLVPAVALWELLVHRRKPFSDKKHMQSQDPILRKYGIWRRRSYAYILGAIVAALVTLFVNFYYPPPS